VTDATSPEQITATEQAVAQLAGFWRRPIAFAIDVIGLGAVGSLIGYVLFDQLVEIGQVGRLIGLAITLLYFGVFDSRLGKGASLGKRLLRVRVINRNGNTISVARAASRAFVLSLPVFLNGIFFPEPNDTFLLYVLGSVLGLLVFGLFGAVIYLYIANKQTGQSLHDIVTDTFVVLHERPAAPIFAHVARTHIVVVACWCLLTLAFLPLAAYFASSSLGGDLNRLASIQKTITTDPSVRNAQVSLGFTTTNQGTLTYLTVNVQLRHVTATLEPVVDSVATTVLKAYPDILGRNVLIITAHYGYDIGIATRSFAFRFDATPVEWQRRIRNSQTGTAL
jgi:uncharacterized RDD family membrane protein YckC